MTPILLTKKNQITAAIIFAGRAHWRGHGNIMPLALIAKVTAAAMPLPIPLITKPMEVEPVDQLPGRPKTVSVIIST